MKVCSACRVEKPLSEFYFRKSGKPLSQCKQCNIARMIQWQKDNPIRVGIKNAKWKKAHPEVGRASSARWAKAHPDKKRELNTRWQEANPEKYRESHRRTVQRRLHQSVSFRIRKYLGSRISIVLRRSLAKKSAHTLELLGCSIDQFLGHLEIQFQAGMAWDNYGAWHVDHIKPCAAFDLAQPAQQHQCFHYSNLQPLWAEDNLSKGDVWVASS